MATQPAKLVLDDQIDEKLKLEIAGRLVFGHDKPLQVDITALSPEVEYTVILSKADACKLWAYLETIFDFKNA